jgi:Flp pilus assembly protein TadD
VAVLRTLADGSDQLARAGIGTLAIGFDPPEAAASVREAVSGITTIPVAMATEEVALSLAILNRHVYMNRQPLVLPSTFLLDAEGRIQRIYREGVDVAEIVRDAGAMEPESPERLGRSIPFSGDFYAPPGSRDYVPWGRELLDEGLEAQAVVAFEQVAKGKPSSSILYRLGTLLVKTGQNAKARSAYERALELQPDLSEASNDLGTLLAESGDLPGAITRFRAALETSPDYPDALNNLGYALLLTGRGPEARKLYERALELQPNFPQALNNLGLILAQQGDLGRAEPYFRKALEERPGYGEAANNLALVLVNRGRTDEAVGLLKGFLEAHPEIESPYLTLAKVLLSTGRQAEGLAVIDRLLQRNPQNAQALEIARAFRR